MYLQRVQVPNFRVLKDVDITFEKEFTPRIFPLGSQNGGGKSTLLQLIFVLLHCSGHPDRVEFIQNLLYGFQVDNESGRRTLAVIDIWDGNKIVNMEFFTCNLNFFITLLKADDLIDNISVFVKDFRLYNLQKEIEKYKDERDKLNNKIIFLKNFLDRMAAIRKSGNSKKFLEVISEDKVNSIFSSQQERKILQIALLEPSIVNIDKLVAIVSNKLPMFNKNLLEYQEKYQKIQKLLAILKKYMEEHNLIHICDFFPKQNASEQEVLLCHLNNSLEFMETNSFLKELSSKIFLAAHVSQVFLFLYPNTRQLLLQKQKIKESNYSEQYYSKLKECKNILSGLFTYDFLAIDTILESFRDAIEKDCENAIKTGGKYGSSYESLLNELHSILANKTVNISLDKSHVNFKIDNNDTELYPEDLSHGELKRLCIYTWMKHNKIENAIVLMDEIEITFHPDWQYQIVRDLEEWGKTNQYILATHSYDICEAVTPAHVKILQPALPPRK